MGSVLVVLLEISISLSKDDDPNADDENELQIHHDTFDNECHNLYEGAF